MPFLESKPCLHYMTTEKGLACRPSFLYAGTAKSGEAGGFWSRAVRSPCARRGCGREQGRGAEKALPPPSFPLESEGGLFPWGAANLTTETLRWPLRASPGTYLDWLLCALLCPLQNASL